GACLSHGPRDNLFGFSLRPPALLERILDVLVLATALGSLLDTTWRHGSLPSSRFCRAHVVVPVCEPAKRREVSAVAPDGNRWATRTTKGASDVHRWRMASTDHRDPAARLALLEVRRTRDGRRSSRTSRSFPCRSRRRP